MNKSCIVGGFVAVVGCTSVACAEQVTATWTSGASGLWSAPSRWSTNPFYPNNDSPAGARYDVVLPSGIYTVTLGVPVRVSTLRMIGSQFASSSLTVNSVLDVAGALDIGNVNRLIISRMGTLANATVNLSPGGIFRGDAATFRAVTINGDVTLSPQVLEGGLTVNGRLTLQNTSGIALFSGTQQMNGTCDFGGTFGVGADTTLTLGPRVALFAGAAVTRISGVAGGDSSLVLSAPVRTSDGSSLNQLALRSDHSITIPANTTFRIENRSTIGGTGPIIGEEGSILRYFNAEPAFRPFDDVSRATVRLQGSNAITLNITNAARNWLFESVSNSTIITSDDRTLAPAVAHGYITNSTLTGRLRLDLPGAAATSCRLAGQIDVMSASVNLTNSTLDRGVVNVDGEMLAENFTVSRAGLVRGRGFLGTNPGLGDFSLPMVNNGRIAADVPGDSLLINMGLDNRGGAAGATGGGVLQLVVQSFWDTPTGELPGGIWFVDDHSSIDLSRDTLRINRGDVRLTGPTSRFDALRTLSQNLGAVCLAEGREMLLDQVLSNSGIISIDGDSSLACLGLTLVSGSSLRLAAQPDGDPSINAGDLAMLDGRLEVSFQGILPGPGDFVPLIRAGAFTGAFASIVLPEGLEFEPRLQGDTFGVRIVPSGATGGLGLALALLASRRRRA